MSALYQELATVFHEPNRLAIISELAATRAGMTFGELKQRCELTDGNLSRHISALEKAGTVRVEKEFVEAKPRTTVYLTNQGRKSFLDYLAALEQVLKEAAGRAKQGIAEKAGKKVKN